MNQRFQQNNAFFDVVIIGGGINGACLYHHLCAAGYKVLLVEKGDFASGTSQATAMMAWGGLLYLKNFDLLTVRKLCRARDKLVQDMPSFVQPQRFRYIPRRSQALVTTALYSYWILGGGKTPLPKKEKFYPEWVLLKPEARKTSFAYQEASVIPSDARFVLQWLLAYHNDFQKPLNYAEIKTAIFVQASSAWTLEIQDLLRNQQYPVQARFIINTAGIWTDRVNDYFARKTPYKHVFSKGVSINFERDKVQQLPLLLDTRSQGDGMALIPWGPVAVWGSTEQTCATIEEGFTLKKEDLTSLLEEYNAHFQKAKGVSDIISFRIGMRPLAVKKSYQKNSHTLELSRRHYLYFDPEVPWMSVYGGKLTSCVALAQEITKKIQQIIPRGKITPQLEEKKLREAEYISFPGVSQKFLSPEWCSGYEYCQTFEDYLRRRTNIAQWIEHGGFGKNFENLPLMKKIAKVFLKNSEKNTLEDTEKAVEAYRLSVEKNEAIILSSE